MLELAPKETWPALLLPLRLPWLQLSPQGQGQRTGAGGQEEFACLCLGVLRFLSAWSDETSIPGVPSLPCLALFLVICRHVSSQPTQFSLPVSDSDPSPDSGPEFPW